MSRKIYEQIKTNTKRVTYNPNDLDVSNFVDENDNIIFTKKIKQGKGTHSFPCVFRKPLYKDGVDWVNDFDFNSVSIYIPQKELTLFKIIDEFSLDYVADITDELHIEDWMEDFFEEFTWFNEDNADSSQYASLFNGFWPKSRYTIMDEVYERTLMIWYNTKSWDEEVFKYPDLQEFAELFLYVFFYMDEKRIFSILNITGTFLKAYLLNKLNNEPIEKQLIDLARNTNNISKYRNGQAKRVNRKVK